MAPAAQSEKASVFNADSSLLRSAKRQEVTVLPQSFCASPTCIHSIVVI